MSARTTALGDVCEIVSGATPKTETARFWGGDIPWATPKDLSSLETPYLNRPSRTITEDGLKSCAARMLPVNSVLLSSRAPIGLVAINTIPMATNQGFKSLVPSPGKLDCKFLYHWLKSKTDYLQSLGNGATFKEISKAIVERIEIPLPPLEEQRRIAALLDKADALRRKRKRALELFDMLTRSVFLEMFGGGSLPRLPLGDLIRVKSGDGLVAKDMATDGPYFVYGGNGINGRHDRYMFDDRKIVIGRVGAYCGSVHITKPKSWVTDNALYVSEIKKPIVLRYLAEALKHADLNQYAGRSAQPLVSGSRIYPIEIAAPNLEDQEQFDKRLEKVDELKLATSDSANQIEKSFIALQSRAFSGQL